MQISAILFDLHHTLTELTEEIPRLWRRISVKNGVDISHLDDETIWETMKTADSLVHQYQLENDVDPHWGDNPEDWLFFDRFLFQNIGIQDLTDDIIIKIEKEFQETPIERITDDALLTVRELHKRGYLLGICTRRTLNPDLSLERMGIRDLFATVQWGGVIGYSKPNPYSLLNASKELGVNPRLCAFVGNYVSADIEAAIRCEMMPILLTWANPNEGPKAPQGTLVLESASDLLQVFTSPFEVDSKSE
ncbi:MAG: HAD family hydrolase [Candidatus Thorarchaeota archaeon]